MCLALTCYLSVPAILFSLAHDVLEHSLMWALHADKAKLHGQYAGGTAAVAWNEGALVALAFGAVLAGTTIRELAVLARERRALRRRLTGRAVPVASRTGAPVLIVADQQPGAWCCPGRHLGVYVTEGAATALASDSFEALVAHERAHLEHRHHRFVLIADVAGRLAARFGLLRQMRHQVRLLVELEADDAAITAHGRTALMRALLVVSGSDRGANPPGSAALAITGVPVGPRVRRLVSDPLATPRHLPRWQRGIADAVLGLAAALPVLVLLLPGLLVAGTAH
jgi:hypothetical protein